MFRLSVSAAVVAAAACTVIPGADAAAAVETCQGQEATIVGDPHVYELSGTPGPDVIVTNGSVDVRAEDGDDTICVTTNNANVRAGRGDDHVDASEAPFAWAQLGPGADTYEGSSNPDTVWAGDRAQDAERDVIATRGGYDTVVAGEPDTPFQDHIATGLGGDQVTRGGMLGDATAVVDLGLGEDSLSFAWPSQASGTWVVDNKLGAVTKDGVPQYSWSGAESFSLPDLRDHPVGFRGGDTAESVLAGRFARIDLEVLRTGRVDGGAGRDVLFVHTFDDVFIDLARVARFAEYNLGEVRLSSVENLTLYGGTGTITIRGSAAANVVRSEGCRQTADGRAGNDTLISTSVECLDGERAVLRGGPGNDKLRGSLTPDRLSGGPGNDDLIGREGRDVANGGPGVDRCAAEVRRSCAPS